VHRVGQRVLAGVHGEVLVLDLEGDGAPEQIGVGHALRHPLGDRAERIELASGALRSVANVSSAPIDLCAAAERPAERP
jgi:hypothetical protein